MADFSGFFKKQKGQKRKGWDEQDKAKFRSAWSGQSQQEEAADMEKEKQEEGGFFKKLKNKFRK